MSELNIFLSALQSAFATSVQQAVAAATAPLVERIAALEFQSADRHQRILVLEGALTERVAALENNPAIGVDTTLEKRVAVLEGSHQMSADAFVTHLDNQEWFWHKVAGFVTNNGIDDELVRIKQRVEALETEAQGENRYLNRDEVNELIAEAMDDHLGTYDHDEYDNHINDDDKHFDGDIEDAVRDALNGTSVTLSF